MPRLQLFCLRAEGSNEIEVGPCYLPPRLAGKLPHEVARLGWYVARRVLPESFQDLTEIMLPPTVEWFPDYTATLTYTKRAKNLDEVKTGMDEVNARGVRTHRNSLLTSSDWTQLADVPLTEEERALWRTYRQELRDMSVYAADDFVWPVRPGGNKPRA